MILTIMTFDVNDKNQMDNFWAISDATIMQDKYKIDKTDKKDFNHKKVQIQIEYPNFEEFEQHLIEMVKILKYIPHKYSFIIKIYNDKIIF